MKKTNQITKKLEKKNEYNLLLQIKPGLLERFVALTGDKSSLHTNSLFARKSIYRQSVVHGVLPMLFVAALPSCYNERQVCSVQKISVRFIGPVFVGDHLSLYSKVVDDDEQNNCIQMEYSIRRVETGAVLATGKLCLKYQDVSPTKPVAFHPANENDSASMVVDSLVEEELLFDQIEKGDEKGFRFVVNESHVNVLFSMMTEALPEETRPEFNNWSHHCHAGNFLAASLFSTFVGMCLPGKYATFTDFSMTFHEDIELGAMYSFFGKVGFKSASTLTMVENISVCGEGGDSKPYATGKANVKLNTPSAKMPSVSDLRGHGEGLGLEGKVVLITGASRGIGETSAKLFSLYGSKVAVNYHKGKEDAEKVANEIIRQGGEAFVIGADVSDREQVRQMVKAVSEKLGGIDILVNNAVRDAYPVPFLELSWEEIQKDLDVTLKGAFNCCQEVLPLMMKNESGKIINLSTNIADNPLPKLSKYVVSKMSLVGLTRSLAVEVAPYGIQVNMVAPSIVETDLSKHVPKVHLESMKTSTPMQRNATPVDVAKAIILLASTLTPFTTGQKIMVTGGNPPFL